MKCLSVSLQLSFAAQCGYIRTQIVNVSESAPSRGQMLQKSFILVPYLILLTESSSCFVSNDSSLKKRVVETRYLSSWDLNITGASSQGAHDTISHTVHAICLLFVCMRMCPFVQLFLIQLWHIPCFLVNSHPAEFVSNWGSRSKPTSSDDGRRSGVLIAALHPKIGWV